jgi:type IV pilus assembly protein PilB
MHQARLDHVFFENESRSHLGALLLRKGLVTNEDLDRALAEKQTGELLGEALCRLRFCFENDVARVLAEQANVDFVDIGVTSVDHRAAQLLSRPEAERLRAIPLRLHPDGSVSVAVADPTDEGLLADLKDALPGYRLRLLVATLSDLRASWDAAYPSSEER